MRQSANKRPATGGRIPLVAAGLLLAVSPHATAQDLGIRAGSFLLQPQLGVTESYSDNVFLEEDDEESDFVTIVSGQLQARSNWSRHKLDLTLSGDIVRFAENSQEDTEQYGARADIRIDAKRSTTLNLVGSYDRRVERRDNSENTENTTEIDEFASAVTIDHKPNRLGLRLNGGFDRRDFVSSEDSDRDQNTFILSGRISYDTSPRLSLFAEPSFKLRDFDETVDGQDRDSKSYRGLVGVDVEISGKLSGELGFGAFHDVFDDEDLDSFTGFATNGSLAWDVTELTRITGSVSRGSEAVTSVAGASGKVRSTIGLQVRHDLKRNLTLRADVKFLHEDFEGADREDNAYDAVAGFEYNIADRLSLTGNYRFRLRDANTNNESFRSNTWTLGLRGTF